MEKPQVYVLTYCRDPSLLYGTTLIFKTLRVGFPNAKVCVVDNASLPAVRTEIRNSALRTDAVHMQLDKAVHHDYFIRRTLEKSRDRQVVFLDPDLCFWNSVEDWGFDHLLAGRLIPEHRDLPTQCIVRPRLHTSFLWISDVAKLLLELTRIKKRYFEADFYKPCIVPIGQEWIRFDTCGVLYQALCTQACCFSEAQLDQYDHLFCGTHLDWVASRLPPTLRTLLQQSHELAQRDYRSLRGIWRWQEEFFRAMSADL